MYAIQIDAPYNGIHGRVHALFMVDEENGENPIEDLELEHLQKGCPDFLVLLRSRNIFKYEA